MIKSQIRRGIVFYPNSGEEWDADSAAWKEGTGCATSSEFRQQILRGIEATEETARGSNLTPIPKIIVGGCCRASPAATATIHAALDGRKMA